MGQSEPGQPEGKTQKQGKRNVEQHGMRRTLIVIGVMCAAVMQTLYSTIINVTLPYVQGNLGATIDQATYLDVRTQAGTVRRIEIALIKALQGSNDDSVVGAWRVLYAEVYQILSMAAPSNGGSYRYSRTFLIDNADLMEAVRKKAPARRG